MVQSSCARERFSLAEISNVGYSSMPHAVHPLYTVVLAMYAKLLIGLLHSPSTERYVNPDWGVVAADFCLHGS